MERRSKRKSVAVLASVLLVASGLAIAKDKRPPQPFAPRMKVEIRLADATLQADSSGFARAIAQSDTPTVGLAADASARAIGGVYADESATKATSIALPLDKKLADYPFARIVEERLRRDVDWSLLTPDARFVVLDAKPASTPVPDDGVEETVLVVVPSYGVSVDNKSLYVKLVSAVVVRTQDRKGRVYEKPKLVRGYSWIYQLDPVKGAKVEDYARRWNAVDRDRLVGMLDQGVERTLALMNYDNSPAGRAEDERTNHDISSAPAPEGARIEQAWVGSIFDNIPGLRGIVPFDWQWQ